MEIERLRRTPQGRAVIELIHNFMDNGGIITRELKSWEEYSCCYSPGMEKTYSGDEFLKELANSSSILDSPFNTCHFTLLDKSTDEYTEYYVRLTKEGYFDLVSESGELFENKKIYNPKRLRAVIEKFVNDGGFLLLNTIEFKWKEKISPYRSNINSNDCNVPRREEIHDVDEIVDIATHPNRNRDKFFEFLKKENEWDDWRDAPVYCIICGDDGIFEFKKLGYTEDNNPVYRDLIYSGL